ncbi:MAG: hypothetical protein Kow0047_30170 [Anaerolineae bacterium]
MVVIIAILMTIASVLIVAWPLLKGRSTHEARASAAEIRLQELVARRDALLTAIRDLEFDHAVGKVPDEDFQLINTRLRAEAVGVLQEIDQLMTALAPQEAELERAIAQRRRRRKPPAPSRAADLDAEIEAQIAALRHSSAASGAKPQPAATCKRCGSALDPGDRFCSRCGAPVALEPG